MSAMSAAFSWGQVMPYVVKDCRMKGADCEAVRHSSGNWAPEQDAAVGSMAMRASGVTVLVVVVVRWVSGMAVDGARSARSGRREMYASMFTDVVMADAQKKRVSG